MRVLLSVRPEFAHQIFEGSKKYEYRRAIFRQPEVKTVVVYASSPVKKVIGEFTIGEILHGSPRALWAKTEAHAGISKRRFFEYFASRQNGYAIAVASTVTYDSPLSLEHFAVTSAPQSFVYLRQPTER